MLFFIDCAKKEATDDTASLFTDVMKKPHFNIVSGKKIEIKCEVKETTHRGTAGETNSHMKGTQCVTRHKNHNNVRYAYHASRYFLSPIPD